MRQNRIIYKGSIWAIVLSDCPKTTREIRRALLECVGCGWAVKWGHKYDIALPGQQLIPTNCSALSDMTIAEWVLLAINNTAPNPTINNFLNHFSIEQLKAIKP